MRKASIIIVAAAAAVAVLVILQLRTAGGLRQQLATATEENVRLRQDLASAKAEVARAETGPGLNADPADAAQKRVAELESEVLRLRGVAGRAIRAEAELAQIKSQNRSGQTPAPASHVESSDGKSSTEPLVVYLGEAVAPPPNLDPAYSKEGLLSAIQQAAANAGVSLKKVEIETSEFPYLAGVVCASDAEFEKVKEQFKKMEAYEYSGSVSSHGVYSFTLIPYRAYPSETGQRIGRRTTLRQRMFFDQLVAGQN